jgi:eukaryotic-like serine/threonine-protein kinase
MQAVTAQNLIGQTVLGRYRIVRRLARGGMGAVYLGRTEGAAGFARPVVIKRVLPGLMDDEEVAQMFVREAQILSNLQHPNIVGVLDFGQQADGAYLMVLEYVHGYQLAQWHDYVRMTQGPMPVDFALHLTARVLDAL